MKILALRRVVDWDNRHSANCVRLHFGIRDEPLSIAHHKHVSACPTR